MKVSIDQLEKKLNINFKDKNKLVKSGLWDSFLFNSCACLILSLFSHTYGHCVYCSNST